MDRVDRDGALVERVQTVEQLDRGGAESFERLRSLVVGLGDVHVHHHAAIARECGGRANHLLRGGVQRVRRDADVGLRIALHQLDGSFGRLVDRLSKGGRSVIRIHPSSGKHEADAGIVRGANRGFGVRVARAVQIEELGNGRDPRR